MSIAIITGSAGLVGSEAVRFFSRLGMTVVGIDNNMRQFFFGEEASNDWNRKRLEQEISTYTHYDTDIRDYSKIADIFKHFGPSISLVIHAAAQPSHDWAAGDPFSDFSVNANGTLNLLQATREYCPEVPFIFTSTNKVYGDKPNDLPLIELEKRWEIEPSHVYVSGISEDMSIDQSKHSLFGASKVAADVLVQEYGRYFGMKTVSFRGGCLTGPNHSGTQLHGFLAYVMRCTMTGTPYTIFGYKGKQVRDNIHSSDLVNAFYEFYKNPGSGEVYNIGGGRESNCSMLEAIELCQEIVGRPLQYSYTETNRSGDHIWYVSDLSKFQLRYPDWSIRYNIPKILHEIYECNLERWSHS
ncbi:NAD-dependent epimerase/dehydratase family protein [Leptolyngbya sp. FACHB-261]|uniref:NAD-dependent epimerase/dehydratase family protein n=1 Tax=Leptolyngbya sp. FACHB-261 TaxID=2692806 RepID=UPI001681EC21|nr:NAD-dependent epimerase/dehydratase family protein [Leptolyngbya sp. FACHB-261]MBD2101546.1 NAD-dependent epimerase/dehydratase family protein [Leptolyngbya sp. FACHB-261]